MKVLLGVDDQTIGSFEDTDNGLVTVGDTAHLQFLEEDFRRSGQTDAEFVSSLLIRCTGRLWARQV